MAASGSKTIPQVGEVFLGDDPAVIKVVKITVGVDCGDVTGVDTTAAFAILNIPANTIIEKACERVVTAWSAGSTLQIGDCDSAAQFQAAASSTTANVFKPDTTGMGGEYYDTPSAVMMTLVNAGGGNTVGKSDVFVWYNFAGQNSSY